MTILVVGVSTRAMVESAIRSGYRVEALDAFGDLDLQALVKGHSLKRDFHRPFSAAALLTASRQLTYDGVAYTSNLENHPEVVRQFAQDHPVLGNPADVLARVRHWPTLSALLAQAGFRVPKTIYPGAMSADSSTGAWLCKPLASGGGHGVSIWHGEGMPAHGFMLQEYVAGPVGSAAFVANGRECVVIGLTEQLVGLAEFGAVDFGYCGNLLPLNLAGAPVIGPALLAQVQEIAALVTREFGLVGVNGLDFVLSHGRVCVIEINPRYSASMELIEWAYQLPIFDLHVQACQRGVLPVFDLAPRLPERAFYGKAILYAERDAVAANTPQWLDRGIRDVPVPGENLAEGSPICTLLAREPTRDRCFASLVSQAERLKGEIYAG
jgi:uncharacterized protein